MLMSRFGPLLLTLSGLLSHEGRHDNMSYLQGVFFDGVQEN